MGLFRFREPGSHRQGFGLSPRTDLLGLASHNLVMNLGI